MLESLIKIALDTTLSGTVVGSSLAAASEPYEATTDASFLVTTIAPTISVGISNTDISESIIETIQSQEYFQSIPQEELEKMENLLEEKGLEFEIVSPQEEKSQEKVLIKL